MFMELKRANGVTIVVNTNNIQYYVNHGDCVVIRFNDGSTRDVINSVDAITKVLRKNGHLVTVEE